MDHLIGKIKTNIHRFGWTFLADSVASIPYIMPHTPYQCWMGKKREGTGWREWVGMILGTQTTQKVPHCIATMHYHLLWSTCIFRNMLILQKSSLDASFLYVQVWYLKSFKPHKMNRLWSEAQYASEPPHCINEAVTVHCVIVCLDRV